MVDFPAHQMKPKGNPIWILFCLRLIDFSNRLQLWKFRQIPSVRFVWSLLAVEALSGHESTFMYDIVILYDICAYIHTHTHYFNIYVTYVYMLYSIIFNTAKLGRNIWGPLKRLRYWPIPMCMLFVFFLWYHVSFCLFFCVDLYKRTI